MESVPYYTMETCEYLLFAGNKLLQTTKLSPNKLFKL